MFSLQIFNFKVYFLLLLVVNLCKCEEITNELSAYSEEINVLQAIKRIPKLLSFKTIDDNVGLGFEFQVPFLNVPKQRDGKSAINWDKNYINLNVPSLVIAGLLIVFGIAVGKLLTFANGKPTFQPFESMKSSRIDEIIEFLPPIKFNYRNFDGKKTDILLLDLLETIEDVLRTQDIDVNACMQKTICIFVKNCVESNKKGQATGSSKLVDGLTSSEWLINFMDGTSIKNAIETAKSHQKCSKKYYKCKWKDNEIDDLIKSYTEYIR